MPGGTGTGAAQTTWRATAAAKGNRSRATGNRQQDGVRSGSPHVAARTAAQQQAHCIASLQRLLQARAWSLWVAFFKTALRCLNLPVAVHEQQWLECTHQHTYEHCECKLCV
jgi:hypothetical protein